MAESAKSPNIYGAIQNIVSNFRHLAAVVSERDSLALEAAVARLENENQRFDLWCRNLGAYRSGHASLEYRLRDAPKVYDYAIRLLTDLDDNTRLASLEARTDRDSDLADPGRSVIDDDGVEGEIDDSDDDEFVASYNAKPLIDILAESIAATIDRLYRLSFKIRNPATRFDLNRILKYKEIDIETNTDVFASYTEFDRNHIKELFLHLRCPRSIPYDSVKGNAEEAVDAEIQPMIETVGEDAQKALVTPSYFKTLDSDFLVQRLVQANNVRRRQLRYWQAHQRKLAAVKTEPIPTYSTNDQTHNKSSSVPTPSLATTEATKLKEQDIDWSDDRSVISSATYVLMQTESSHEELHIPPFPRWLKGKKEFRCPYCHIMCPGSMARRSAWETHVLRDLRPYICTFETCPDADQLYDTFQSWTLHETQAHLTENHESEIPSPQSSLNIKNHESVSDATAHISPASTSQHDTRACPLCLETGVTATHIGAHLQRVAIFALPLIQSSAETDGNNEHDSNRAINSADANLSMHRSHSDENSNESQGQQSISEIAEEKGSNVVTAQEEVDKQHIMDRYLDTEIDISTRQEQSAPDPSKSNVAPRTDLPSGPSAEQPDQRPLNHGAGKIFYGPAEKSTYIHAPIPVETTDASKVFPKDLFENEEDPDVIHIRFLAKSTHLEFPPYSIAESDVYTGELRHRIADWLAEDPSQLRLIYKDKELDNDGRPVKYYGVKQNSEITVIPTEGRVIYSFNLEDKGYESPPTPIKDRLISDWERKYKKACAGESMRRSDPWSTDEE